ncbi:hypothetical protein XA68_16668 [Ophiocordyceps unilateralis]|uniref:Uncharacterized protein n=1 Tax=Ophiocordyceps unilateralis TaxID=268505 RepID=A0A2A9PPD8_OPHUN|nr:hypothetical protein XA68_16668 [Ophiocordyceps unilateralis]
MSLYVNDSRGGFRLDAQPRKIRTLPDVNMNLEISQSTADGATWANIQGWLATCLETHHRCNERLSANFVPSRLLRLETATAQAHRCLRRRSDSSRSRHPLH